MVVNMRYNNTSLTEKHSEICLNCDTILVGHYCHICGQDSRKVEPSLRELALSFFEIMTHADSKVMCTLKRLFFDPPHLTRDYIKGKRASEIPPLRMFFVSLLLFFSFTSVTPFHRIITAETTAQHKSVALKEDVTENLSVNLKAQVKALTFSGPQLFQEWLHEHLVAAVDDPDEVQHVMGEWAERVVLLLLPISSMILWLLYAFPKSPPLYDHFIVSLHSLTVLFLVVTFATALGKFLPDRVMVWLKCLLALAMIMHLFTHLKGFYGRSTGGTMIRMVLLGLATGAASLLLTFILALIGLQFGAAGE